MQTTEEAIAAGADILDLAATLTSHAGQDLLWRFVKNPKNGILALRDGQITESLATFVCLALKHPFMPKTGTAPPAPTTAECMALASELLASEGEKIIRVARHQIGTHNLKGLDAGVESAPGLTPSSVCATRPMREAPHFAGGATCDPGITFGASGNSADARAWTLLCARFSLNGVLTSIAKEAVLNGSVKAVLTAIAGKAFADDLAEAVRQRTADNVERSAPYGAKTLLWPLGDGRYASLTPVTSFALQHALNSEMAARRIEGASVKTSTMQVGGSKPQNVSDVNLMIGGAVRLLSGLPPRETLDPDLSKALAKAARGESLISNWLPERIKAALKNHSLSRTNDARGANLKRREGVEALAAAATGHAVKLLSALAGALGDGLKADLSAMRPLERALVTGGAASLTPDQIRDLASTIADAVLNGGAQSGRPPDDNDRSDMRRMVVKALLEGDLK